MRFVKNRTIETNLINFAHILLDIFFQEHAEKRITDIKIGMGDRNNSVIIIFISSERSLHPAGGK